MALLTRGFGTKYTITRGYTGGTLSQAAVKHIVKIYRVFDSFVTIGVHSVSALWR